MHSCWVRGAETGTSHRGSWLHGAYIQRVFNYCLHSWSATPSTRALALKFIETGLLYCYPMCGNITSLPRQVKKHCQIGQSHQAIWCRALQGGQFLIDEHSDGKLRSMWHSHRTPPWRGCQTDAREKSREGGRARPLSSAESRRKWPCKYHPRKSDLGWSFFLHPFTSSPCPLSKMKGNEVRVNLAQASQSWQEEGRMCDWRAGHPGRPACYSKLVWTQYSKS